MSHDHDDPGLLSDRKVDHLVLCRDEDVESKAHGTLLDDVQLLHNSLPELAVDDIDMSVSFVGKRLRVPLMVSGMTGGAAQATEVNRVLAAVAERHGMAFGVGSQRAMLRDPALAATYRVRDVAPTVAICGNIGAVQAAACSPQELADLVGAIDADALCIHLNPAQEIVQAHGDRDFVGCLDGIARAVEALDVPVIAKETGCGMSPDVLDRLVQVGVGTVDVSGRGGTTWVGVEALRAPDVERAIGEALWDWGIPTAAAVAWAARRGLTTVASGGLRNGHDAARAIALGATVASSALPWLRAAMGGGADEAELVAQTWVGTLRAVMLLTGARDIAALRRAPRIVGPELARWLAADHTTEAP